MKDCKEKDSYIWLHKDLKDNGRQGASQLKYECQTISKRVNSPLIQRIPKSRETNSNSLIENGARHRNKQFKEKKEMPMLLNYVKIYEHSLKVEKNKSDIGKENNEI